MTPATVYIRPGEAYSDPIRYTLKLLGYHVEELELTDQSNANIVFDHKVSHSEAIALHFYETYQDGGSLDHMTWMTEAPVIRSSNGLEDLIATCFYMVNCLQERDASEDDIDQYGRFKFTSSYQHRFQCITEDLVTEYFEQLASRWGLRLKEQQPTRIHMSHDIDVLGGSVVHQVYRLGRQGRISDAFESIARGGEVYNNLEELDSINSQYGVHSTYFFLTEEGRGKYGIKNADYDIAEHADLIRTLDEHGNEIGLHKSVTDLSFEDEFAQLPVPSAFNRYHFLCHQPHRDWKLMEDAGVRVDCSLGFAEHYGFRNSYGLPFRPYDPDTGEKMNLIVSPLHVMDGTLWSYMSIEADELTTHITDFIQKHKTGKVISILWHNNSITDIAFAGLRKTYEELLRYIQEQNVSTILLSEYSIHFTSSK